jgi:hypothetical protein
VHESSQNSKGGLEASRQIGFAEQVHIEVCGTKPSIFFKALKGSGTFQWGPEQQPAFEDLKMYIETLAVMSSPLLKAELLLYIASSGAVQRWYRSARSKGF